MAEALVEALVVGTGLADVLVDGVAVILPDAVAVGDEIADFLPVEF